MKQMEQTEQQEETRVAARGGVEFEGIDYVEFYVGNAHQAAYFYYLTFGMPWVAYAGLETGARDRTSYVVQQRDIRLVMTSPLQPESPIAEHIKTHGDSVKDIALRVKDATRTFEEAVKRGARPVMPPTVLEDERGHIIKAAIQTFGDTVHSFVERHDYDPGAFEPLYQPNPSPQAPAANGLVAIDHVAVGVEAGELDRWVRFYEEVLGFHQSHREDVSTEQSAMNSKVVENETGTVKFPMVEPGAGRSKSQIDEYLAFHRGAGTQHIALLTEDIVTTVRALREKGIQFLHTPDAYYETLTERVGEIELDPALVRDLNILVDRDGWGQLLQIFTKPLHGRPTVFMEIIERQGARGFGGGNIKALFDAIEREQARRANL
ncbi:MAG TPA: 4-hydroxyphenylpyruvate dioxygenase [Pyrinomonadaceae bacterium]|nr:4-hydroxyphenylpyruvate dioxygenase [Pyrinomonadaceae bacterium]